MKTQYKSSFINPDYSFDNYILNRSNQRIVDNIKSGLSSKRKNGNHLIFLHGAYGTGKTHLLQAIAKKYKAKYFTCEQFVGNILTAIYRHKYDKFAQGICKKAGILLIDDIHFLRDRPFTMIEVMHVLDRLRRQGKIAIISADRPLEDLSSILAHYRFRTYELKLPDERTLFRYVKREERKTGINLTRLINIHCEAYPMTFRMLDGLVSTALLKSRMPVHA